MNRKIFFKTMLLSTLVSCLVTSAIGQKSKWYLQLGGGYNLMDRVEQLGFDRTGPSGFMYAEIGRTFRPLSVGVQESAKQSYDFYKYRIHIHSQMVYAKYNFNHMMDWLPVGLDPYVKVGATLLHVSLDTYQEADFAARLDRSTKMRPAYTFGAGVQIGSRHVVLGMHYEYTPGKDVFDVSDFGSLPFATGVHTMTIDAAIRIFEPSKSRRSKCPRFGGKGIIRF